MSFKEFFLRFAPALSAPAGTPAAEVFDVVNLAQALYTERKRYLGMHADALEFMDSRVALCPSADFGTGTLNAKEAQYRYTVALELWLKIQRGDKSYIGQTTVTAITN